MYRRECSTLVTYLLEIIKWVYNKKAIHKTIKKFWIILKHKDVIKRKTLTVYCSKINLTFIEFIQFKRLFKNLHACSQKCKVLICARDAAAFLNQNCGNCKTQNIFSYLKTTKNDQTYVFVSVPHRVPLQAEGNRKYNNVKLFYRILTVWFNISKIRLQIQYKYLRVSNKNHLLSTSSWIAYGKLKKKIRYPLDFLANFHGKI